MGCMLRSDKMSKCSMYLQPETAFDVLDRLGELGCVQFIDMNPEVHAFRRNYVMEVCRFSEMERKLNYIQNEMRLNDIEPLEQEQSSKARPLHEFAEFEVTLEKWKDDIQEMTRNEVGLLKSFLELVEFHYVLTHIGPMLGDSEIRKETLFTSKKGKSGSGKVRKGSGRLMVITGLLRRTRCHAFEMMLWRISHGIVYFKQASEDKIVIDPQSRQEIRKIAFLVICQGEALAGRIQKICTGFQVNTFPIPNTSENRLELQSQLQDRIYDIDQITNTASTTAGCGKHRTGQSGGAWWRPMCSSGHLSAEMMMNASVKVLAKTKYLRCKCLREVYKNFRLFMGNVKKSKAIYFTMNMFRSVDNNLICECWIPDDDFYKVNDILSDCSESSQSNVPSFVSKIPTHDVPPTYHRVNKFTRGFQNLINAYGDSTYRELNPGLYTLITFPFLFAMMFGDVGHGLVLVLVGSWMVKYEKQFEAQRATNEIWSILFGGRYVVLMMGLFSLFTGFCYNDVFSRAFSIYPSYWLNIHSVASLAEDDNVDLNPSAPTRSPYLFGEDPVWRLAKNKIMFENSFKMKISIVIGIIHMMFGIILSFFNYKYFKRYYSIVLQFLPELLFLTLLFFWLVVLCFLKWFFYSPKSEDPEYNTACAPQILLLFIDMVLMSETKPANEGCKKAYMFEGQRTVQMILVFSSALCVPIMLLGTPLYLIRSNKKQRIKAVDALRKHKSSGHPDSAIAEQLKADVEKYSVPSGELMLHQGVHTIEFVLSTISHTASYLRLWALSLAHSQLSEMLWAMILSKLALHIHSVQGAIRLIPIFALWAVFTISILVVMEGLSAFLHCLRLHWVEFMSKFYHGGGWPFRPYSFEVLLEGDHSEPDARCKKFSPLGLGA